MMGFAISFILKPRFWQEKFALWDANKLAQPNQSSDATSTPEKE
jgi:hypothetical protein